MSGLSPGRNEMARGEAPGKAQAILGFQTLDIGVTVENGDFGFMLPESS